MRVKEPDEILAQSQTQNLASFHDNVQAKTRSEQTGIQTDFVETVTDNPEASGDIQTPPEGHEG